MRKRERERERERERVLFTQSAALSILIIIPIYLLDKKIMIFHDIFLKKKFAQNWLVNLTIKM